MHATRTRSWTVSNAKHESLLYDRRRTRDSFPFSEPTGVVSAAAASRLRATYLLYLPVVRACARDPARRHARHARVPRVPTGHGRAGAPHKTPEMGVGSRDFPACAPADAAYEQAVRGRGAPGAVTGRRARVVRAVPT